MHSLSQFAHEHFGFVDGVLDSIAPHDGGRNIDGVSPGTPLSGVTELYGAPPQSVANGDGTHTVFYGAEPATSNAYRIVVDQYSESGGNISGFVKTIVLCRCAPKAAPSVDQTLFTPWADHGRGMQLNPDGTGALNLASGAANNEKWALTWTTGPSGAVTITSTRPLWASPVATRC